MTGLVRHGHHRQLTREQLMDGDWQLDQPLLAPNDGPLKASGAEMAAAALIKQLE